MTYRRRPGGIDESILPSSMEELKPAGRHRYRVQRKLVKFLFFVCDQVLICFALSDDSKIVSIDEYFRASRAGIVLGTHNKAIGTCGKD